MRPRDPCRPFCCTTWAWLLFVNRPKYINLLPTMPIVNPSSRHYKPKCVELYRSVSKDRQYFCPISSEYYRSPRWETDSNQIVKKFGRNQNRSPRARCQPISDQKTSSLNSISVTAVLSELPCLMHSQFREAFFFFLTIAVYKKQFPNFNRPLLTSVWPYFRTTNILRVDRVLKLKLFDFQFYDNLFKEPQGRIKVNTRIFL